jgi:hypothetical protein
MKKGKAPLALLLTFILLFMASSGASAAVIGSAAYWWDATETGTNINIASLTIENDAAAGNSFSLYSWADPTNVLTLVSPVSSTTTITYPFGGSVTQTIYIGDNASGYILKHDNQYYAGIYNTSNYITLGATPRFGFSFSDGSNTYLDYTLANQGPGWNLTGPNGMTVNVQGGVTPSAVPIPGSLLLFGSGLLGLWGIGSRRNKAQLA